IDLPLKNPPAATDRLIGHDPSGAMFQATLAALTGAVLGNISVVENAGRLSIRIPTGPSGGIQIAYHPNVRLNRTSTNALRAPDIPANRWIQPFSVAVRAFGVLPQTANSWNNIGQLTHAKDITSGAETAWPALGVFRLSGTGFPEGSFVTDVAALAVGRY
ncbi:MAG TPA: hypothetical protein VK054_10415, partial [Beutenbergiaceae bacterium]|nr:hypothetical protein [Beutenbergiaceae bacterium]